MKVSQESYLHSILEKNRIIESLQEEINELILEDKKNRLEEDNYEAGYTESIESYYVKN